MDRASAAKVRAKYVAPIEEAELAIRICEAVNEIKRPPGSTAVEALNSLDDDVRAACRRAAVAVMEYWRECIEGANRTS